MCIHWFAFTVHTNEEHGRELWQRHFFHSLGALTDCNRKGRGFENIEVALNEAKFYYNPIQPKKKIGDDGLEKEQEKREYYHIEIPGSACDCLVPRIYQHVVEDLQASGLRWSVKRIDIAWDAVPFSPVEFCAAFMHNYAVTLAKRETLSITQSPFEIREDASGFGCDTCYIGSKASERFIRVYNKRGFNRLEFVCRDERAHVVTLDIFGYEYQYWNQISLGHLLQYLRFGEEFGQWHDFMQNIKSSDIKISSARVVSLSKIESWFERQVSVALSVFYEVWGTREADKRFAKLILDGQGRDRSRYRAVLQLANAGGMVWS